MEKIYILFSGYFLFLFFLLLYPFQISLNKVKWLENSNGISFQGQGQVISLAPAASLLNGLQKGNGITIEAWISTDALDQDGPARIVSYSINTGQRNFTIGQSKNRLVVRLRTSGADLNATTPLLAVEEAFTSSAPVHFVLTYDFLRLNIYLDGRLEFSQEVFGDHFASWDPSHYLILGNEATGDRPWHGNLYYLAIYNRALGKDAIDRHSKISWVPCDARLAQKCRTRDGLVVNYLFNEQKGARVQEIGAAGNSLQLHIPFKITNIERLYLSTAVNFTNLRSLLVVVMNVLVFIPLGMLLHSILSNHYGNTIVIALLVFAIGSFWSFFVENVQFFMPVRHSSLIDLFCNMVGTAIGVLIDRHHCSRGILRKLYRER